MNDMNRLAIRPLPAALAASIAAGAVLVALAPSCERDAGDGAPAARSGPPVVYTTFYPTLYFTRRIAGDLVDAVCPVPEGEDPIFWKPDAATVTRYQAADLIVLNGAGFEKWVETVSLPTSRIVDTARSFEAAFIQYEDAVTHSHGPAGEHSHEGLDGHTWLDPVNALAQARAIRDALAARFPERREAFERGFEGLARDLGELDTAFRALAGGAAGVPLLCSHPAYNYIARRYGWRIHNLDLDPETMPSDEALAAIREVLAGFPARHLLWESEPLPEIAARFERDFGVASVVFSPCELLGEEEAAAGVDYLAVMLANLERVRPIFSGAAAAPGAGAGGGEAPR